MKYFIFTICGVVLAAVVAGFLYVGSPRNARLRQLDEIRLGNLQQIQYEVINYWQSKEKLPLSLDDLYDATRGVSIPSDPAHERQYEYIVTGDLTFDLCATFALQGEGTSGSSMPMRPMMYPAKGIDSRNAVWQHVAGRYCFSRTIDKDFYPPFPKTEMKR
ncbi:MAG: hypothetical protein AAB400_03140 [Patescibacteria group bacterium]